jgi:rhodanese-related sulfurtransferase
VETTVAEITCEALRAKLERGDDLVLIDALPPISFAASHLPGAINIPPERVDALCERRIPDRDAEVVVYCANPKCASSVQVAARLAALGYRNVLHYAGGKDEWRAAGLPLEGGRV